MYLRPIKSPNLPKNNAPNGRTTKPAANVANVDKNAAVGLSEGKILLIILRPNFQKYRSHTTRSLYP